MLSTQRAVLLLAVTLLAAGTVSADTFYNNLNTTVRGFGSVSYYQGLYNAFTTGSTPENLTDVQVKLRLLGSATGSVTVALYAEALQSEALGLRTAGPVLVRPVNFVVPQAVTVGQQLTVIGAISDSSVTSSDSGQNYDFPLHPGYPLAANTLYFIGLTTSNNSQIGWAWNDESDSISGIGTADQYHCYGANYDDSNGLACVPNGDDPFLMLINGGVSSVPAMSPTALVPLGILLLAIPLWLIRKKYRFET